jgi:tetratricopeptide (TPR) repeat protein
LLTTEAEIDAMSGHFDEGRAHLAKATALADELGLEVLLSSSSRRVAGIVELAASDYEAAVKPLADGCAALERMGDWGHFTSLVPYLVDALYPLGRADEAAHWVDLASRYELMDDLDAQIGVRRARAKLEAHRGDLEQGLAFAQEAVTLAENTDFVDLEARSREDLAELLLRAGRPDEASAEFGRAVALYEQKGNVAAVGRLRTEIPAAAQPPATA